MSSSDSVQAQHLQRKAAIYIRQSSPHQVATNLESQHLQYALRERALQLGWHATDVETIDDDLGQSGASIEERLGFQRLFADVGLGKVGILIAYDATRLARNCSHWYQLLDLCGRADCLIADRDGIYDPATINDRLLLGLKGQISELELYTLRARLNAGLLNKAKRGELALRLPTGLVRSPGGVVTFDPDQGIQERLRLVFSTMAQKRSLTQVVRHFREHELTVPRRDLLGDIAWRPATVANVRAIVTNPAYAGAFVYGRKRLGCSSQTGKKRRQERPAEQWIVCVKDKYPAYLCWEEFERLQAALRDNHSEYARKQTRGMPRAGQALLHGIVYCGECGHKMVVQYKYGTRYVCQHLRQLGERVCQYLAAEPVERQVVAWFFEALSVAEIDAAAKILQQADQERDNALTARRRDVQRLAYQARLAERQYQCVDPENRLVAGELERRWETALSELRAAEATLAQEENHPPVWAIPADLLEALKDLGPRLPELWEQGLFAAAKKKLLLRCLIDKVVLRRVAGDRIMTRVVWRGGAATEAEVATNVGRFAHLSEAEKLRGEILELARRGLSDDESSERLTRAGYRSPKATIVLPTTVQTVRLRAAVFAPGRKPIPRQVAGHLTIAQLAAQLGISSRWIYARIYKGTIQMQKHPQTNNYLFPDNPDTIRQFRLLSEGKIATLIFSGVS
jgi:DNA invertase Pin-like site-specific DNA recombinase